jgi:hypothetical protein
MAGIRIRRRRRGRPRTVARRVLCEKAYSSRAIPSHLRRRRITAVIPEPADQQNNRSRRGSKGDADAHPASTPSATRRNVVERVSNKLKAAQGEA